jgi:hypothetical protein
VLGNPPFGGTKYQSILQREQVRRIAGLGGSGGTLDFVTAWFLKAGAYVQKGQGKIGFVSTNSVTQGEQAAQLWPLLFNRYGLEIDFAHRTFAWGSDARGMAHVHVVIIGLAKREQESTTKRLFSYDDIKSDPVESQHKVLSPYLFDASLLADRHLVVEEGSKPLCDMPRMITGTQPIDNGQYIFTDEERTEFLATEPSAKKFLRPYMSGVDFLAGESRWILALQTATPTELQKMPHVKARMHAVREFRKASARKGTKALANFPERYNVEVIPASPFLAVPEVSSERREYIPMAWLEPPIIPSGKIRFIPNAELWQFGILTSAMHMAWTRAIGGRLKSDYQYSVGINYNAFPFPEMKDKDRTRIAKLAQAVLDARSKFADATLIELYDADVMKPGLRKAHQVLDTGVDRSAAFKSDRDRVEHLFGLYEKLVSPLALRSTPDEKLKRRRAKSSK